MRHRAKGVIITEPEPELTGELGGEAKQLLKAKQERRDAAKARRDARPVPNYLCYPEAFKQYDPKTGNWSGGRLPRCRVCDNILQPEENHVCEGFTPKYVEHDEEWQERWEQRREDIREMRRNGWHYEADLDDGMEEDEPEDDYCEDDGDDGD